VYSIILVLYKFIVSRITDCSSSVNYNVIGQSTGTSVLL